MIGIIFSLDYEIYGTGKGDFSKLMIDPTDRLLDMFNRYGAKLTIMADVAEILALKRYPEFDNTVKCIEHQLRRAIRTGHDVQLHLHPGWFNAVFENESWLLDFQEYSLVGLSREKIDNYIGQGKAYLEDLLQPVNTSYRCVAYRAGNWLMQPSRDIVASLEAHNFIYDSSVYKGGVGKVGRYTIDYTYAHHYLFPWSVMPEDISLATERDGLIEIPILCRRVAITSMLTMKRIKLQLMLRRNSQMESGNDKEQLGSGRGVTRPRFWYPKKFDFCRLTCREMKSFLKHTEVDCQGQTKMIPMVAIGHSTEYLDDGELESFIRFVNENKQSDVSWLTFYEYSQQ